MTMSRLFARSSIALLGLLPLTAAVHAAEVYSNLGPGDSFDPVGWVVSGPNTIYGTTHLAASFVAGQNYLLTGFDVAATHLGGLNSYLFSIVADSDGFPIGTGVYSTSSSITDGLNSFAASGSLAAGKKYWLVMQPGTDSTQGAWKWNITGGTGFAYSGGGGNWELFSGATPAFRINGRAPRAANITPEVPAGVQAIPALLAVGGMALWQRRKKSA